MNRSYFVRSKERQSINSDGLYDSKIWSEGYLSLHDAKLLLVNDSKVSSTSLMNTATLLFLAAKNSDIEIVEMLLDKGVDVNVKNDYGRTPLYNAIEYENIEIIKLLLIHAADVNTKDNKNISPLEVAIGLGYTQIVEYLIEYGADVDYVSTSSTNEGGYSPLIWATTYNDKKIITLLLNNGANINIRGINNITPLHVASEQGFEDSVELFLNRGADVNAVTDYKLTPLHIATKIGHRSIIKLLLKHGANVDAHNIYGQTILNLAVETGCLMIVQDVLNYCPNINNKSNINSLKIAINRNGKDYQNIVITLLEYGFSLNAEDSELLYVAIKKGYLIIVECLLKLGIDVNCLHYCALQENFTLLHIAALNKQEEIGKLLISYGADINAQDKTGKAPLFYAIKNNDLKFIKLLLTNGADIKDNPELLNNAVKKNYLEIVKALMPYDFNINAIDNCGRTALHYTVLNEWTHYCIFPIIDDHIINVKAEIAKLLLSKGADVNAQTKTGLTTLHVATERGYMKVVEALLEHNAEVNIYDLNGKTPFHYTLMKGSNDIFGVLPDKDYDIDVKAEIVKLLLSKGANADTQIEYGVTALHVATEKGYKNIVKDLLEYNANVNCRTQNGRTPLHIAVERDFREIMEIILNFNADVNAIDEYGKTALYIASVKNDNDVVKILLEYGSNFNFLRINNRVYLIPDLNSLKFLDTEIFSYYDDEYNEYLDYEYCLNDEIVKAYKCEVIKLEAAKIYVNEETVQAMKMTDMSDFKAKCKKEIANMKCQKIDHFNISFYDILVKNTSLLAAFMKNEDIVQVLKSKNYITKFPIYAEKITCNFMKAMHEENVQKEGIGIFHLLFNHIHELPYDCIEQIVNYLNKEDIKTLRNACKHNQKI